MTGGNRGDEQLRQIPSRRIAAEHRVGRAGYGRFALRANLVRTRVGAVRRRRCPATTPPGVEIEQGDGAGQFESVTLRPHAKLAAGSDENIARRLHDAAAEKCFIARSVSFRLEHEPTFDIGSA